MIHSTASAFASLLEAIAIPTQSSLLITESTTFGKEEDVHERNEFVAQQQKQILQRKGILAKLHQEPVSEKTTSVPRTI